MRIVVLAGGIGGARFLAGVRAYARDTGADVTAVVNVGDDVRLHGLRICPDLDSVMYTLGGGADPERGWGRVGETLGGQGGAGRVRGRADLVRPRRQGHRHPSGPHHGCSTPATRSRRSPRRCATRWQPGVRAAAGHRRPAGDARRGRPRRRTRAIHFQEWWVRHRGERADPPVRLRRRGDGQAGARRARGARRRRRGAGRAQQPGGQHRADPRRARAARGAGRPARRRWSASRRSSAARRCAGMADKCLAVDRRRVQRRPASARCTARGRGAACSTAGWWTPSDAGADGARRRRSGDAPLWMTDEAATAAMVGARCGWRIAMTSSIEILPGARHRRRHARRRPGRADRARRAVAARRRRARGHQQDRVEGRGPAGRRAGRRARSASRRARGGAGRRDRPRRSPGAVRPGSCRPTTAS